MWRISASASRPVRAIDSSTGREGCAASTVSRTAPACTTMRLTWWATTSWSSRAMRTRSSATAWRASSRRSWLSRSAVSRSCST